jgi:hypothetical protein
MIKTQPSMSIEYLFELRSKLGNVVERIEDQFQRGFFTDLLDILLLELPIDYDDIQKRGIYKALILGTEDLAVINSFVGADTSELLSDESSYLVSINRTFREQTLKIDFIQNKDLSEEARRIITSTFRRKNPKVDIGRSLGNSQIPSLSLKDVDLSLLQSFDDDIKLLKSTGLIRKITVDIHFYNDLSSNNDVFSLCRCVDIVPPRYNWDEQNSINLLGDFSTSKFYNFIILNTRDDFSIKAFLDLFLQYEDKLEVKDKLSRKIMENIFYGFDNNILNQTRLLQEKPEYREKIKSVLLKDTVSYRHSHQAVLFLLSYLEYFFLQNSATPANLYSRTSNKVNQNINRLFNKMRVVIGNSEPLEESELFSQMEIPSSLKKMEIGSLFYTAFNSKTIQDILFEIAKLLSYEILMIMANNSID